MRVVVADLGLGNLRSVERAVERAAKARGEHLAVCIAADADTIRSADFLVFPGQGAFRDGSRALATAAGQAVADHVTAGKPYFGICLGLQLLFEASDEAPGAAGLGFFKGSVRRLGGEAIPEVAALKVPHMGWNRVQSARSNPLSAIDGEHVYFVHSFAAVPSDDSVVSMTADYGARITAAVHRDHVLAVQFHPEKSQAAGARVLDDALAWAEGKANR